MPGFPVFLDLAPVMFSMDRVAGMGVGGQLALWGTGTPHSLLLSPEFDSNKE